MPLTAGLISMKIEEVQLSDEFMTNFHVLMELRVIIERAYGVHHCASQGFIDYFESSDEKKNTNCVTWEMPDLIHGGDRQIDIIHSLAIELQPEDGIFRVIVNSTGIPLGPGNLIHLYNVLMEKVLHDKPKEGKKNEEARGN